MRALVVVNPHATTTTQRVHDVLVSALSSDLQVRVVPTKGRGHAVELGRLAVTEAFDLIVVLGGDGTVNEVVNGLLRDGPDAGLPALAVVPGGSTNVFARSLGYARSAVEATGELLEALRDGRSRQIGLGMADDRWFTFCGGLGFDAAVVRRVEARRAAGRRHTAGLYARSGLNRFYLGDDRRQPQMALTVPGAEEPELVQIGLVCNTSPWTYFDERPIEVSPTASFDLGLDVFALRRLKTVSALRSLSQMFRPGVTPHGRNVVLHHDLPTVRLAATGEPLPLQLDGEDVGDVESVTFRAIPRALRVIA